MDGIEEEDKEILHRKWISQSDLFEGLLFALKSTLKFQNSPPEVVFLIRVPRSGSNKNKEISGKDYSGTRWP